MPQKEKRRDEKQNGYVKLFVALALFIFYYKDLTNFSYTLKDLEKTYETCMMIVEFAMRTFILAIVLSAFVSFRLSRIYGLEQKIHSEEQQKEYDIKKSLLENSYLFKAGLVMTMSIMTTLVGYLIQQEKHSLILVLVLLIPALLWNIQLKNNSITWKVKSIQNEKDS